MFGHCYTKNSYIFASNSMDVTCLWCKSWSRWQLFENLGTCLANVGNNAQGQHCRNLKAFQRSWPTSKNKMCCCWYSLDDDGGSAKLIDRKMYFNNNLDNKSIRLSVSHLSYMADYRVRVQKTSQLGSSKNFLFTFFCCCCWDVNNNIK